MVSVTLDIDSLLGRRAGLEDALRRAVLSGQLPAATKVPSSRALARELGVARATVVAAYEQLTAEGYLLARQGAGTVVAPVRAAADSLAEAQPARSPFLTDLLPGEPDHGSFPRAHWAASLRRVLASSPDDLFAYGDHRGLHALRSALAGYLARSRVVVSAPARIVVFGGYMSALSTLAEALHRLGVRRIALEDPCLPPHARAVAAVGPEVVPIGVDRDGIRVQDLDDEGAVVCTPTHQYPVGVALSPSRRLELAAWARDRGSWIVEDDYDGEFRYDRPPVGALHSLAPEQIVYAGTASKSLAPGLGIAWLVLPPTLVEPVLETKRLRRAAVSTIEQAALADFIVSGRLDRHVRRMRTVYRRRRDAMVRVLAPRFEVIGLSAGLHVTALSEHEDELIARARARSIALFGIGNHIIGERSMHGLVVGYSRSPGHAYVSTLKRLDALVHGGPDP